MRMIDLSLPIDDDAFEVHEVSIDRVSHEAGVDKFNRLIMGKTLKGKLQHALGRRLVRKEELPDQEFLSLEVVHAPVHIGTHLDYSYHYGSRSEGRLSKTADEIPLEYCYHDGVRIELCDKKPQEVIRDTDISSALQKMNYTLKPLDIVLLRTGADRYYGSQRYFSDYPGVDTSAIDYMLDRGVKIFGVDTMGIDRPYRFMLQQFLRTRSPKDLYPAHFYGRTREFIHIERLTNLDKLPDHGFKVICFPVRIKRTGAAWSRVVALVEEKKEAR